MHTIVDGNRETRFSIAHNFFTRPTPPPTAINEENYFVFEFVLLDCFCGYIQESVSYEKHWLIRIEFSKFYIFTRSLFPLLVFVVIVFVLSSFSSQLNNNLQSVPSFFLCRLTARNHYLNIVMKNELKTQKLARS